MATNTLNSKTVRPLAFRQQVRLAAAYLLIPLVLFLSSGDPGWWPAWLYSFLVLATGIGGRIWAESRHPGLTAERQNLEILRNAKRWDKVLAPLMAVTIGYPMVLVAGLDHRCNWSAQFPLWLVVTGFILVALGYASAAWALAENRFFYSVVSVREDRGHVVCDTGPYSLVRHPAYAGNVLGLFGMVLALGSVWSIIPATVASIVTLIRTTLEDKALRAELSGYREYTQRVRYRLIPAIY